MKHPLRKVVIPAAGLGTRFLPATKAVPKEMLPIVDVPTIQLIVEEAVREGAEQAVVVHGRGKYADGSVQVEKIVENPARGTAPSNLAVIGRYLLPPDIFAILEKVKPGAGGEIQLTDALAVLASQGRLLGVRFQGERHDAGDRLGYLQANLAYALKRPELRDPLLEYLRQVVKQ